MVIGIGSQNMPEDLFYLMDLFLTLTLCFLSEMKKYLLRHIPRVMIARQPLVLFSDSLL